MRRWRLRFGDGGGIGDDAVVSHVDLADVVASTISGINADVVVIGAAVGDASEIAWRANDTDTDLDAWSEFYGASVTKQMVGLLLARAVIDGALDPADLVSRWLPELAAHTGSV